MSYLPAGDELIARQGYAGLGLSWGDIRSFGGDLLRQGKALYDETQVQRGRAEVYQQIAKQPPSARMPGWVLPTAIGGTALVTWLLLRRR